MRSITACFLLLVLASQAFGEELNRFTWKEWEKYGTSLWVSDKEAAFEGLSIPKDLIKTVFVVGYLKGFDEARYYILDQIRTTRRKFIDEQAKVVWSNAMARVRFAIMPLSRIESDKIVERLDLLYSDYSNLTIDIEDAIFSLLEEYNK